MQELETPEANLELKELVAELSLTLGQLDAPRLDAPRLEELALFCEALNWEQSSFEMEQPPDLARQVREAAPDMVALRRMLAVAATNQSLMRRLRKMRERRLEWNERQVRGRASSGPASTGFCRWGEVAETIDGDY